MLIPNQMVEVKIGGRNINHYRSLGYDVKFGETIIVPPEHLTDGSHVPVQVICDICQKIIDRPYKEYLKYHTKNYDVCDECSEVKRSETINEKYGTLNIFQIDRINEKRLQTYFDHYGVTNPTSLPEIQEKKKKTCRDKYGVDHPMSSDEIKNKVQSTNLERYGNKCSLHGKEPNNKTHQTWLTKYGTTKPTSTDEIKEKVRNTMIQKYGHENSLQVPEIYAKYKRTMIERYGYDNPLACPEILAKAIETKRKNGKIPTSKQQLKLYDMVKQKYSNAELNYPFSKMAFDVYIESNNVCIDIEYDAYIWHDPIRDERRDAYTFGHGVKVLRTKSSYLLPTEQELFDAIDYLINTEHYFKDIILSDWKEKEEEECQEQLQVAK